MRVASFVIAVCMGLAARAAPVAAAQPTRNGLSLGFGLGGGTVSLAWPDDERQNEHSGAGALRVAWAVRQDLLVGIEGWAWSKDYELGSVPENVPAEVAVWSTTLAATFFPGNTGFFLRGGIGVGGGRAEVTPPPSVVDYPVSGTWTTTGWSLVGASGYEIGVTPHLALGGTMHIVYVAADDAPFDNVLGYGLTVQFNWYW
jgi:hypothetical protein